MPTGVYVRTRAHKQTIETRLKISKSKKGSIPWNKGKTNVYSEETLNKIREARKRQINPMLGKHHSEETKKKIGLTHKGKTLSEEHKKILSTVNWKGGKYIIDGYMRVYTGNGIYIFEHRLVMEKVIGRKLKPEEVVHHINGNTLDNRPENLKLFKNISEHTELHEALKRQKKVRQLAWVQI
jgi:hypothetical protein